MRIYGKQNSLFPLGPVIKCLIIFFSIFKGNLLLRGDERLCSPAAPRKYTKLATLTVKGQRYQSFSFPVVPIEIGTIPIRVAMVTVLGSDQVEKQLLVEVSYLVTLSIIVTFSVVGSSTIISPGLLPYMGYIGMYRPKGYNLQWFW